MPETCSACNKVYSNKYNLAKHYVRQPLCKKWQEMNSEIKSYVDDKFAAPILEQPKDNTTCQSCGIVYSNVGNLNKHLENSVICSKWDLYNSLEPVQSYMKKYYRDADVNLNKLPLYHIIWNLFLTDRDIAFKPDITDADASEIFWDMIKTQNIKYVAAILPNEHNTWGVNMKTNHKGFTKSLDEHGISNNVMLYDGHTESIDLAQYDAQIAIFEEHRRKRENVLIFCNKGYQRSLPFIVYYLVKFHHDEVPTISQAMDIILPQIDKEQYKNKMQFVEKIEELFSKNGVVF
jgi:hypothetical protein